MTFQINGAWIADANLNPKDWTRSSSATAYLFPNIERENLSVSGTIFDVIARRPRSMV